MARKAGASMSERDAPNVHAEGGVAARREFERMANLDRTMSRPRQAQRTELRLEGRDGAVWLSIAVGGQHLSARIEPGLATRMGTDLIDMALSLAPEFGAEGH